MVAGGEQPDTDDDRLPGRAPQGIAAGIGIGVGSLVLSAFLALAFPPLGIVLPVATGLVAFVVLFGSQDQGRSRTGCGVLVAYLLVSAGLLLWISGFE